MSASLVTKTAKTADASPASFPLGFLDRNGDGASLAGLHALVSATGALVNPATAEGLSAIVSALAGALTVSQASQPLPTGAATETTLGAAVTALNAMKAALLAQVDFTTLFVTDGSSYYVRRETVAESTGAITVSFETMAGAAATPVVANLTPVVGASGGGSGGTTRSVEATYFDATANGTGITAGDVLARVLIVDLSTNSIVGAYWHNMMTGAAVTPTAGAYAETSKGLPTGAATATAQAAGNASLASLDTKLPAQASNLATGQVSVGTAVGGTQIVAARAGRRSVVIIQEGTTLVRLGASGVTAATGIPLPGTAYSALTIDGGAAVFGIVASGTQTVSFVEIY